MSVRSVLGKALNILRDAVTLKIDLPHFTSQKLDVASSLHPLSPKNRQQGIKTADSHLFFFQNPQHSIPSVAAMFKTFPSLV